jgi:hypothetical protein
MPVASVDLLHGIVLPSASFISQFTDFQMSPMIEAMVANPAGLVDPLFVANMGQKQEIRFGTTQLKTVLDSAALSVVDLSGGNTDLYLKAAADQGSRGASASLLHYRFRVAQGLMMVDSISAGHRTEAVANCRLIAGYDGTNVPIVYAGTVAVAGTPTSAEHFVVGECYLNGAEIEGVQDLSIDFGRQMIQVGSSGELYDTFNAEGTVNPTITIRAFNSPFWSTATINGLAATSGSFYLRKLATVGRVADATAEHIKFAITDGLIYVDTIAGDGMSPNVTTITIKPVADSSTAKAVVLTSTAVAITS